MPRMTALGREEFARLEAGRNYYWKVEDAELKYSTKGDEQIKLTLKVGDKNGQVIIFENLTFNEKAFFHIEQFMKSAGRYPGDNVEVDFSELDVVGLSGWCTIRHEKSANNGREYARIDKWIEADRQVPDREWIERARVNRGANGAGEAGGGRPAPIDPDDIPF